MSDVSQQEKISAFEFPCAFPIKIVGLANDQFEVNVLSIMKKYFPQLSEGSVKQRPSAEKKYLCFTVTVPAQSKEQLDNVYQELSKCSDVIMAL